MYFAFARYRTVREGFKRIHDHQNEVASLQKTRENAERTLNLPQNQGTREYSQFLNTAILRKSFSWTGVLADLEKIMPPRLHVSSIQPQLDKQHHITVQMQLLGQTRDAAIELVRGMEKSEHFRNAEVTQESRNEGNISGLRFTIVADYIPATVAYTQSKQPAGANPEEKDKAGKKGSTPQAKPKPEERKPAVRKGAA
jgi:hypothetical protein